MEAEAVVLAWLAGWTILAGWVAWDGLTGGGSDGSWPAFLPLLAAWPLIAVIVPVFFATDVAGAWWRGEDLNWRDWR